MCTVGSLGVKYDFEKSMTKSEENSEFLFMKRFDEAFQVVFPL